MHVVTVWNNSFGGWVVERDTDVLSTYKTVEEALGVAEIAARLGTPSEVRLRHANGVIEVIDTFDSEGVSHHARHPSRGQRKMTGWRARVTRRGRAS